MRDALDADEVARLLGAATALADKLLLGLLLTSEAPLGLTLALRWMDVDLAARRFVASGAPIAPALIPLMSRLAASARPVDYVFKVAPPRRHLSPGDAARIVTRSALLARVPGRVTLRTLAATDARHVAGEIPTHTVLAAVDGPQAPSHSPTMRLAFEIGPPEADGSAQATVIVQTALARVRLDGIRIERAHEAVPDVVLPVRESWRVALSALDPAARRRVEAPRFYRVVVTELVRRLTARAASRRRRLQHGTHRVDQVSGGERLG